MIAVGIGYLVMGSPFLLKKPFRLNYNELQDSIHKLLLWVGLINLVGGIFKYIFPSNLWYIVLLATMFAVWWKTRSLFYHLTKER